MPFGEDVFQNNGVSYTKGTPAAFGCIEVKRMLARRARDLGVAIPTGFSAESPTFGVRAAELCAAVQPKLQLAADGVCGPDTMRVGFKYDLRTAAQAVGLDFELICKLISLESGFNPSAYNPAPYGETYANGTNDKGIGQKNGSPSDDAYWNVLTAFAYSCDRLSGAMQRFGGQVDVAIASYNVGNGGAFYYEKGRDYIAAWERQVC